MSTDYPQNLAAKLKHIRVVELDYSEAEMADALGVTAAEVSEFEDGRRELPLPLVLKYEELLVFQPIYCLTTSGRSGRTPASCNINMVCIYIMVSHLDRRGYK